MGVKCRLICIYRPSSFLLSTLVRNTETFVVCGDLNFPGMRWDPPMSYDASSSEFLDFLLEHGITQFVTCPTHRAGNVLDLVMGSDEFLVNDLMVNAPLLADHFSVSFNVDFHTGNNNTSQKNATIRKM